MSHHEARVRDLVRRIQRQHADNNGHGPCPSTECERTARAEDHCFICLTQKLGAVVGEAEAHSYLRAVQSEHHIRSGMLLIAATKDQGHE